MDLVRKLTIGMGNALVRAEAAMQARGWQEALESYETAIKATHMLWQMTRMPLDPNADASMQLGCAAALLRMGRDAEAEDCFAQAIRSISSSSDRKHVSTWHAFRGETRLALQGDETALKKVQARVNSLRPLATRQGDAEVMVFYGEAVIEKCGQCLR